MFWIHREDYEERDNKFSCGNIIYFCFGSFKKWNLFTERAEEIELKPTYNFVVLNFRELKFKFRLENIYSTIF